MLAEIITQKPPFAALHTLASDAADLTTAIEALGDCDASDVKLAATDLEQAANCFLINVRNTVFVYDTKK